MSCWKPSICRFMRGVYISRPTQSRYSAVWDVKVVLDIFRQWKGNAELSLKELSLKTATLVALVSAQRVQSLHKLDLDCMAREKDRITFKFDLLKPTSVKERPCCGPSCKVGNILVAFTKSAYRIVER